MGIDYIVFSPKLLFSAEVYGLQFKVHKTGKMETIRLTEIPIEMLWEYREHKLDEVHTAQFIAPVNTYEVDEIAAYINTHGIEPLQLSVVGTRALLTDGNHRIVAARQLGYTHVPVYVMAFPGDGKAFIEETRKQFKPLSEEMTALLRDLYL